MLIECVQIFAAYIIADGLSGIYHLMTDLGYNIPSQVRDFNKHHDEPWTMQWDYYGIFAAIPAFVAAYFMLPWFFISLGICLFFIQYPHYYNHHPEEAGCIVKFLQKIKVIIGESHTKHHEPPFDKNFCVFTGWNDWWLNPIGKFCQRFDRKRL